MLCCLTVSILFSFIHSQRQTGDCFRYNPDAGINRGKLDCCIRVDRLSGTAGPEVEGRRGANAILGLIPCTEKCGEWIFIGFTPCCYMAYFHSKRKIAKIIYDDNCYCKYYETVYILFHTGLRISEFCGLTLKDVDLENKILNIDHQLQRTSSMKYVIEKTKTNAGSRSGGE